MLPIYPQALIAEMFSNHRHLDVLAVFIWIFFSSLLLWEFVHDKINLQFAFSNRGLVVICASPMASITHKGFFSGLLQSTNVYKLKLRINSVTSSAGTYHEKCN